MSVQAIQPSRMVNVIFWTIVFSITTALSILLLGSRDLLSGQIGLLRLVEILFDWRFIAGAFFAFLSRLVFLLINHYLYNMPKLSQSSTSITTVITLVSVIAVLAANHYFLREPLYPRQLIGASAILLGVFLTLS